MDFDFYLKANSAAHTALKNTAGVPSHKASAYKGVKPMTRTPGPIMRRHWWPALTLSQDEVTAETAVIMRNEIMIMRK